MSDGPDCVVCDESCGSLTEDVEYNHGLPWGACVGCTVELEPGYDEGGRCWACGRWCRVCLKPFSDDCGEYCRRACDFMDSTLYEFLRRLARPTP